jgi:hypothetical protein
MTPLLALTLLLTPPPTGPSADALAALKDAIAKPTAELAKQPFASVPLTKADAAAARQLLWAAHAKRTSAAFAKPLEARVLTDGDAVMPFDARTFGDKPAAGHSLWISLHGGGGTTARVNDQQWRNQQRLYTLKEGMYVAPRAPGNTWDLWHTPVIDRLFATLIEGTVARGDVDPDRVYVLGYSAGGDGVYQLAPRMADRWAAAGMMAGHPNGISLLSLRNVPFALQVGEKDAAYDRNKLGADYGAKLDALRQNDPAGYEHLVKIHAGKPHWMGGDDKLALPWMAKFRRDPVPTRVVWKQTGVAKGASYWLAVPPGTAKVGTLIDARRAGQSIDLAVAEGVSEVLVRLDDRMLDLDRPVTVTHAGKTLFNGTPPRTVATMLETLAGRGDPHLTFDAEVRVRLPQAAAKP